MKTTMFNDLYNLIQNPFIPTSLEQHIRNVAKRLSAQDDCPYTEGDWASEKIGNGWFLNLSENRRWRVVNPCNYTDVHIGGKGFSLAIFVIALSEFSIHLYQKGATGDFTDELAMLHNNAMTFVDTVLNEDDLRAFCSIID